jgi:hypothetical protein
MRAETKATVREILDKLIGHAGDLERKLGDLANAKG